MVNGLWLLNRELLTMHNEQKSIGSPKHMVEEVIPQLKLI